MSKKKQYTIEVVDKSVCESSELYYLPAPKTPPLPPHLFHLVSMIRFAKLRTNKNKQQIKRM